MDSVIWWIVWNITNFLHLWIFFIEYHSCINQSQTLNNFVFLYERDWYPCILTRYFGDTDFVRMKCRNYCILVHVIQERNGVDSSTQILYEWSLEIIYTSTCYTWKERNRSSFFFLKSQYGLHFFCLGNSYRIGASIYNFFYHEIPTKKFPSLARNLFTFKS